MRLVIFLGTYFLLIANTFAAVTPAQKENLQHALDQARIDNKTSALQMTIILPNEKPLTLVSGETEKNGGKPITEATLFQIGSETKSFTAALILKLEMAGKLKLSDTLDHYFPEYKKWGKVKITELLHNNSGIYNYSEDKAFQKKIVKFPNYQWQSQELIAIAAKHADDFKPGFGWHYSNTNFILAGMIAEKVTQQPLAQLYKSDFLGATALNLTHTYYLPGIYSATLLQQMAHGYDDDNRDITYDNMSWGGAAGAMVANSYDLAVWANSLFHGKVLPATALQQMMELVSTTTGAPITSGNEGYGMGIGMRMSPKFGKWWGHEGETLGYHAIFIWYPQYDLTAAVIANGSAPQLQDFATKLPGFLSLQPISH